MFYFINKIKKIESKIILIFIIIIYNNLFTMNNIKENYDYYKIPLKCALYVLEKETTKIKKKITFSKNEKPKNNNNDNTKQKYIDNEKYNHENNITNKYNEFISDVLFIIEKNYDLINEKKIFLLDLFNNKNKEKYFRMLSTKEKDYQYWNKYSLIPPIIKISELLNGKINIIGNSPNNIYFEIIK